MKIGVVTIPERGHIHPLLGVMQHLERRGHALCVAAARDLSGPLQQAGLRAVAHTLNGPPPPAEFITSGAAFTARLQDPVWLRRWITTLLVDLAPAQLPVIRAWLDQERPDLLVLDPMVYAAVIAATERGLPWAGVSSSLNPVTPPVWRTALTETLDALGPARAALWTDRGLAAPRFRVADVDSPWLNTVYTVPDYAPREAADNAVVHYVGAPDPAPRGDEPPFPWERLRRGAVYASFGSQIFHQPRLFQTIFQAVSQTRRQVVCSVGDLVDEPDFVASAPEGAILVRYAPQRALLQAVHFMISHGGANSAVEALSAGVPLCCVPICNDQPLQGRLLAESGAGLVVAQDADLETWSAALRALERCRPRTLEIAAALGSAGGSARVADLVERLGQTGQPVLPEGG